MEGVGLQPFSVLTVASPRARGFIQGRQMEVASRLEQILSLGLTCKCKNFLRVSDGEGSLLKWRMVRKKEGLDLGSCPSLRAEGIMGEIAEQYLRMLEQVFCNRNKYMDI